MYLDRSQRMDYSSLVVELAKSADQEVSSDCGPEDFDIEDILDDFLGLLIDVGVD